ncbi:MAG: FlgD immunoglobulin-like domain containing protein, partial [bacterium]
PVRVGYFDTGYSAISVDFVGTDLYVADSDDGLYLLEFDPPPTPTFVASFSARAIDRGIDLSWEILSDDVVIGFKIYRTVDGPEKLVNRGGLISRQARSFLDESAIGGMSYRYVLVVVLADGSEVRSQPVSVSPRVVGFELHQNHPNPFNPVTAISFTLPERAATNLSIYNIEGTLVTTLVDETLDAGFKEVTWRGRDAHGNRVSTGVYFYRLTVGKKTLTKKMLLLK